MIATPRRQRKRVLLGALLVVPVLLVGSFAHASDCAQTSVGFKPLNDLGTGRYEGYQGGLYPGGSNSRPASHTELGLTFAQRIAPRDPSGAVDATRGRIVFLSIGMSNALQEFRVLIDLDDPKRDPRVMLVNGAAGGYTAERIDSPDSEYWTVVDEKLARSGATRDQVQAVWLKESYRDDGEFPEMEQEFVQSLRSIVQILKDRFPNLWLVYLSSRVYAGYSTIGLSPEPYAYRGGFAVKWLIEDQLDGKLPPGASTAPWLSWGPYLWADGVNSRSDGLEWECKDFNDDGTHTSDIGGAKVANMLLNFMHSDPTARTWYEQGSGLGSGQMPGGSSGSGGPGTGGGAPGSDPNPDGSQNGEGTASPSASPTASDDDELRRHPDDGDLAGGDLGRGGRDGASGSLPLILAVVAGTAVAAAVAASLQRRRRRLTAEPLDPSDPPPPDQV